MTAPTLFTAPEPHPFCEEDLRDAVQRAWAAERQVDVTLMSGEVLRGTALLANGSIALLALFGVKRTGLPVATATLRLEEIDQITTSNEPADATLGLLPHGDEWVADLSWKYSATDDGAPAYGSALRWAAG